MKDTKIVLDKLGKPDPSPSETEEIVRRFLARRKDAERYSLDADDGAFVIHSPDPLARSRGRKQGGLPENLLKCPFCSFVTPYQELYDVHFRSHGFVAPA